MNTTDFSINQLKSTIFHSLDNGLLSTAEFTAERLLALGPTNPSFVHLYALTLYRRGDFKTAYNMSANHLHAGCAYVFSQCCVELDLAQEGISAMTHTAHLWDRKDVVYDFATRVPDAAACFVLLGKLHQMERDIKNSCLSYLSAIKLNPFLFEAFEEVCKMGASVKIDSLYKVIDPVDDRIKSRRSLFNKQTVSKTPIAMTPDQGGKLKQPDAPQRKSQRTAMAEVFKQPALNSRNSKVTSRLLVQPLNTLTSDKKDSLKRGKPGHEPKSSDSSTTPPPQKFKSDAYLMELYSKFAKAFKAMARYDSFKAIRILGQLPENEQNSPWVLGKLGRLHFEIVNYDEAEVFFQKLRKLRRTRVQDMEYYSTLLWHLHKEPQLSFLAHELHDIAPQSPQAWVSIGNMFSLTKEPEEAIKCFQRAITFDPNFAYAHTLQGHEYVACDAFENALQSFRMALVIDPRHYNALYGIGMIYLKLGKVAMAEFHFRKAVDINPVNVILICCVGMALEKQGKRDLALKQYTFATKLQPLSALALFKKAQSLFQLHHYELALRDFEKLQELAPDEASVHFLMGQLYKVLNENKKAMSHFTTALSLDPKGSQLVRDAMESLHQ